MSACFLSPLQTKLIDEEEGRFQLVTPLIFFSEILGGKVTVPEGFDTDFASVPRIPIIYVLYANRGRRAATVHDFMYRTALFERGMCDKIFREALQAGGENLMVSWAMWVGVRVGGIFNYKGRSK